MDVIIPDEGLEASLNLIRASTLTYHLFTNNITIDKSTVLTDFLEATVAGYAAIGVLNGDWGAPSVTAHIASIVAPLIVFTCTSPGTQDCYGYYVTDNVGGLLAAAKFDSGPIALTSAGIPVIPILGSSSRFG